MKGLVASLTGDLCLSAMRRAHRHFYRSPLRKDRPVYTVSGVRQTCLAYREISRRGGRSAIGCRNGLMYVDVDVDV